MKFTTIFATAMLLLVPTVLASPHRRQDEEDTTDVSDPTNLETIPSIIDTATGTDPEETDTGSVTIPEGTGTPSITGPSVSATATGAPSVSVPTTSRPATTTTPATTSKPATTSSASSTTSGNAAVPTGKVEGLAVAGIIAGVLAAMV